MKTWIAVFLLAAAPAAAQQVNVVTNPASTAGYGSFPISRCLTDEDYRALTTKLKLDTRAPRKESTEGVILYADPVSGGINSLTRNVVNYVDLDASPGLLDYNCGTTTYDGHNGIDIDIPFFYDMDEGVPILCAAPGIVVDAHDGEFDRRTAWLNNVYANYVLVQHADGSVAYYYHMRKGSVAVTAGQPVSTGQVLGMIGSSGFSSGPHLHFETWDGFRVDPFTGPCQGGPSWWASQPANAWVQPFAVIDRGVTLMPMDWPTLLEKPPSKTHVKSGTTIRHWVRIRNVHAGDELTWKLYRGSIQQGLTQTLTMSAFSSGWAWVSGFIPLSSVNYGNWRVDVLHNNVLVSQTPFAVNGVANQPATIAPQTFAVPNDQPFAGLFQGTDPDGSIFWYRLDGGPYHGTLEQYGGRARKFRYTPDPGFIGRDSIDIHAVDDENLAGPVSSYVFDVDIPTATLLSHFEGNWTGRGIELRWGFGPGADVAAVSIQRAGAATGPWSAVMGERRDEADAAVLLDSGAEAGRTNYYRLIATPHSGEARTFGPFAVTAGAMAEDGITAVAPTPTHDRSRVEFAVAREERVRLMVMDVQGRVVATLADGVFPAGRHQAVWDAHHRAGLFFVRCDVGGRKSVRKVIVTQ